MSKYGAIIGRFQLPELHEGHKALINYALKQHESVIMFLGTRSSPPTGTNPLSFETRKQMILNAYESHRDRLIIVKLNDMISDTAWSAQVDDAVSKLTGDEGVVFYCGRDNFSTHYHGQHRIVECSFGFDPICAKNIRAALKETVIDSHDFRAGMIHGAQNAWHRQYHTVDMALVKTLANGIREICLIRKPGMDKWQFPGGFCDKGEKFSEAASRELLEETGLVASRWTFLNDFIIEDWRTRGIEGVDHKTVLMFARAGQNDTPVAGDDAEEAKFFNVENLIGSYKQEITNNHQMMFECLLKHLRIRP